jgi:lambda family phage portal protein
MSIFDWRPWGRRDPGLASKTPTNRHARRAYASAAWNKQTADWVASSTSQDAETRMALRALRNRSRDLERNNDWVVGAFRTLTNNVVGTGVRMQSQIKIGRGPGATKLDKKRNFAVEQAWLRWCRAENCHTGGMLAFPDIEQLLIHSVARDGDVGVRMIKQRFGKSKVPFALEVVEADLLDEEMNGRARNGNEVRMGVEVDVWQRPVAYHFFTRHPGDYQVPFNKLAPRIRVPAEEIIWLARTGRANQTRGVPWLASAALRLRHMGGFEEAEVIAARASACQMGFIQQQDVDFEDDKAAAQVEEGDRVEAFEPGRIARLGPGESYTAHNPTRPSNLLTPFMSYMLRGVASGVGVSFESLSKDYSQSNFSSSRMGILDDRDNWRILQLWMIRAFHQRVFEAWMEMAVLSGVLDLPSYEVAPERYDTPKWMPRGWGWIDPAKEIKAFKDAVRSGFGTQTDVLAQNGQDFDEMLATRRRELDAADEAEIIFDTDPRFTTTTGQSQVPGEDAAEAAAGAAEETVDSGGTEGSKTEGDAVEPA